MTEVVLDASALLAALLREPGHDRITPLIERARMSSVNLAEVVTKLTAYGLSTDEITGIIDDLELRIEHFSKAHALAAGLLSAKTSKAGLSLGDRACLCLAIDLGLPAITADKAWSKVDVGAQVKVIS